MFPTLYKKNTSGKLMQWDITVEASSTGTNYQYIVTRFGQVGGKIQETKDLITTGKNLFKANETTVLEQAMSEAKAKWQKQVDTKGYVQDIEMAMAGEDEVPGFKPMLAHPYEKQSDKITWPAACQPKLDGIRCCATIDEGIVTLTSRTGKPITAVPHIEEELSKLFPTGFHKVDGELYNHGLKDQFEKLVSIVRKQKEIDEDKVMQYHVYDLDTEADFSERYSMIEAAIGWDNQYVKPVLTVEVADEDTMIKVYNDCISAGYEGAMVRNLKSPYEGKRSVNLQKVKEFKDDEFDIIGIEEGRGKLMGHAAAFVCKTPEGKEFKAKMKGDTTRLKDFFNDHSLWEGKQLTVRFFEYTAKEGVPRFPVGIAIRDYE